MIIRIKDVEPFNLPNVDNEQAGSFLRRLSGMETFEFNNTPKPKSMVLFYFNNRYPDYSNARGALLSIGIDQFQELCRSATNMAQTMKPNIVGYINIEYGGNIDGVQISATKDL
jgi:hypothetical protein